VHDLNPGEYTLRLDAQGYVPFEWKVTLGEGMTSLPDVTLFHDQDAPIVTAHAVSHKRRSLWRADGKLPTDFEATTQCPFDRSYLEVHVRGAHFESVEWTHRSGRFEMTCTLTRRARRTGPFDWAKLERLFLSREAVSIAPDQQLHSRGLFPQVRSTLTAHGHAADWEEIDRLHLANQIRDRLLKAIAPGLQESRAVRDAFLGLESTLSTCIERESVGLQLEIAIDKAKERARVAQPSAFFGGHLIVPAGRPEQVPSEAACARNAVQQIAFPAPRNWDARIRVTGYRRSRPMPDGMVE
jgi:hypothetical protein